MRFEEDEVAVDEVDEEIKHKTEGYAVQKREVAQEKIDNDELLLILLLLLKFAKEIGLLLFLFVIANGLKTSTPFVVTTVNKSAGEWCQNKWQI